MHLLKSKDRSLDPRASTLQVTLEGNLVNLDVTSPASTLALGLMFLKTNNAAVAGSFTVPSTRFALDLVRPDFIMLRVLARNLVMWDAVQPTSAWLSSQLPDIIQVLVPLLTYASFCLHLVQRDHEQQSHHGAEFDSGQLCS